MISSPVHLCEISLSLPRWSRIRETTKSIKSSIVLGTGNVTVSAGATVSPTKSGFTISSGTVTITGGAVVDPTKSTFTLASGTAQAIVWSEIIPGVSATWIPIAPGI